MGTGEQLKLDGMTRMEGRYRPYLPGLRAWAAAYAAAHGTVTTDDVRQHVSCANLAAARYPDFDPHLWGTLLRDRRFRRVGYRPSLIPSNHARVIGVYALKEKT